MIVFHHLSLAKTSEKFTNLKLFHKDTPTLYFMLLLKAFIHFSIILLLAITADYSKSH